MGNTYIYGLVDPRDGAVFYIGKSDNPMRRLDAHLTKPMISADTDRARLVQDILASGHRPVLAIFDQIPIADRFKAETWWIEHFRSCGKGLTNSRKGGNGRPGSDAEYYCYFNSEPEVPEGIDEIPPGDNVMLTVRQVCDVLGTDGSTIRRWCQAGKLPGATFVGEGRRKNWLIPTESLEGVERDPRGWKRGRARKERDMRITVVIDDDNTSLYGTDPAHVEGVDQVESLDKLVDMTRDAVAAAYPQADIRVLADQQSEVTVTTEDPDGYTIEDDATAEAINSIAHEVWESWKWLVLLEPQGPDLER